MFPKFSILIIFVLAMVGNILGLALSKTVLLNLWPNAPQWSIFSFNFIVISGLACIIFLRKGKKADPTQPPPIKNTNYKIPVVVGLVLGSIMSGFSTKNTSIARVHFDNGTPTEAKLVYTDRAGKIKELIIKPDTALEVEMPIGLVDFKLNNTHRQITTVPYEKQIFNIDTANIYILMEMFYGKEEEAPEMDSIFEPIVKEFFKVEADYLFKAPGAILTRRSSSDIKRVLYRIDEIGETE